jgi:hypothetical protein
MVMKKTICLFLTLGSTVPVLSFAENPNFQEGQTTVPEMRQYFEGRKAEYNQYLADLAAYNQAIIEQQAWDNNKIQEDQEQQQTQASLQAAIDQQSQQCPQEQTCQQGIMNLQTQAYLLAKTCPQEQTEQERITCQQTVATLQYQAYEQTLTCEYTAEDQSRQICQQAVADSQTQMQEQAAEYSEYRQDQAGTRPVVGQQPTFHDNTAELDKAYIFDENQRLEEKVNIVGERNMTDEQGNKINTEEDVRNYYTRNYNN